MCNSSLVISLDFELFWGIRDKRSLAGYRDNLLGVRQAIPAMLTLFKTHSVHATFATVGMLNFATKNDLLAHVPDVIPQYRDRRLDPYADMSQVGANEQSDPFHFAPSLIGAIADTDGMEIGTHTFSHYYCLEPGADGQSFSADLEASQMAFRKSGLTPTSIVFPRNQYSPSYLAIAKKYGLETFRGNPKHSFYATQAQSEETRIKRLGRLLDNYLNISGSNGAHASQVPGEPIDVPASRFLRPYSTRLRSIAGLQTMRLKSSMLHCAKNGLNFHLWWHPHNFGGNLSENIAVLDELLNHFRTLRDSYGMQSHTMAEAAKYMKIESGLAN
jgi:peptidoglycan/xylan/chitin deacetylase (PgdA/CDA1 family)